jgi:hypothetical protein
MTPNDWATLVLGFASLGVSYVAFRVSRTAMARSDRNSSASNFLALYEGFRSGWLRFQAETDPARSRYEMSELMNTFEIACALRQEGAFTGNGKKVLDEYLCDTIKLLAADADAATCIRSMIDSPTTFEFISLFQAEMRRTGRLHAEPLIALGFRTTE